MEGDTNGDGKADFQIEVHNIAAALIACQGRFRSLAAHDRISTPGTKRTLGWRTGCCQNRNLSANR